MMTATTKSIAGYQVVENFGVVDALVVAAIGAAGNIAGWVKGTFGGDLDVYTGIQENTRKEAFDKVRKAAAKMNANAVIGLRFHSQFSELGILQILCYGTAVKVEPQPAHAPDQTGGHGPFRISPPQQPAPPQQQPAPLDLTGEWVVTQGTNTYPLHLTQLHDGVIKGTYEFHGGTIVGKLQGHTLEGAWQQSDNKRGGPMKMTVAPDGQSMTGTWEYNPDVLKSGLKGSGTWTFRRKS